MLKHKEVDDRGSGGEGGIQRPETAFGDPLFVCPSLGLKRGVKKKSNNLLKTLYFHRKTIN